MTRPIVTVTLNPAIDRTVWVDALVPGSTHRTSDTRTAIGGKGVNVARVAAGLGASVVALGLAGEDQADAIEHHLSSLGVWPRFLRTPGETRTNLKIIEQSSGRLTEINGSGPEVTPALIDALEQELITVVERDSAAAVVLAGSLPLGVDAGLYARWTRRLKKEHPAVPVIADTSDEPLDLVAAASPFLLKPNRGEAEGLVGQPIETAADAAAAATRIAARGSHVLLSLGSRGAVAAFDGKTAETIAGRRVDAPAGQLRTTVGAGDAMVARFAFELARRDGHAITPREFFDVCRLAVAQAEAHIGAPGSPVTTEPGVVAVDALAQTATAG